MTSATVVAQPVSIGGRAGVPISPESSDFPSLASSVCQPNYALGLDCKNNLEAKPYAIGPSAEVFLPWRLSVEADALYRRFHQDISEGLIVSTGGVLFGERASAGANGWWFPLLLKYSPIRHEPSFFLSAGATLRHLGAFDGQGFFVNEQGQPAPGLIQIDTHRNLDAVDHCRSRSPIARWIARHLSGS